MFKQAKGWCKQVVLESQLILRISRKVTSKNDVSKQYQNPREFLE